MTTKSVETLFLDLDHARTAIAAWVEDYNQSRPHSILEYETPVPEVWLGSKQGLNSENAVMTTNCEGA